MNSLKQLYNMTMDVHARLRTKEEHEIVARFNERFILSLGSCERCLVIDDELNILPLSSHSRSIEALESVSLGSCIETKEDLELKKLKASLKDTEFVGSLVGLSKTLDQAKAILTFIEAISEKTLRTTVTLTAARGRGKSAALGVAVASAIVTGYSNIFITSPSPENLKTLFEFVFKGFDCLGYKEHLDYEIMQSSNPEFNKCVVRVNVLRGHRQTIQYIHPKDCSILGQCELLIIDEAAAIPLPDVKKLLGPYLVFMCSTVNGYEGTGRSLSLKLIKELREQSKGHGTTQTALPSGSGRVLRELSMKVPIRYANGDHVEKWLNELLCLDATTVKKISSGCPHPSQCNLYYVNRDTLFSYHKASEEFLQRMMALYVSSHYKNSPNDLILMSDSPTHHLFVLLGPVDETSNSLPEILVVLQVCMEGEISKKMLSLNLARGKRAAGDLIPWVLSQQFQDEDFASLSGVRVVRIATHPDYQRMGYGRRTIEQLKSYYQCEITNIDELDDEEESEENNMEEEEGESGLLVENIKPRSGLPPLLSTLEDRKPEAIHWIGTSFGLTLPLYNFWFKSGFFPTYLRLTANDITGEHSCIMLTSLSLPPHVQITCSPDWLKEFHVDFKRRFVSLLSFQFGKLSPELALSLLNYKPRGMEQRHYLEGDTKSAEEQMKEMKRELDYTFSMFDIKRLESYSQNLVDYHTIMDLVPPIARFYFLNKFSGLSEDSQVKIGNAAAGVNLSYVQAAILLAMGLQHKVVTDIVDDLKLQSNQVLAMFTKTMRKVFNFLRRLEEWEIEQSLPIQKTELNTQLEPLTDAQGLEDELQQKGQSTMDALDEKRSKLLSSIPSHFMIKGTDQEWDQSLVGKKSAKGLVSIKRKRTGEEGKTKERKKYKKGTSFTQTKKKPNRRRRKSH
eukprot:CAMPEP_0174262392 /NCGR_PEP_ID=MMETSP0439-20130205/12946_1 /TAXON_ID=0 /ORGANISM="Stereomyxa ramosa, Strain Chinc5" /LENGTH=905 /DNA_ID=CAMNT_0015347091 /DNA_START=512 /DNA_END=3229 /DNA_ORIENTATION=+